VSSVNFFIHPFTLVLLLAISSPSVLFAQKPENLDQCHQFLDGKLSASEKVDYQNSKLDDLSKYHMGLGLYMRNNWIRGARSPKLVSFFGDLGLFHPDDISSVIIDSYWHYLNKSEYDLSADIVFYQEYWENAKKEEAIREANMLSSDNLIAISTIPLQINNSEFSSVTIPYFKHHIWPNEFTKYKNGFIINDVTTTPGRPTTVIKYQYYYLDLKSKKIAQVNIPNFDTIWSIIVHDNHLIISGLKNNKTTVFSVSQDGVMLAYPPLKDGPKSTNQDKWAMLAYRENELICLQKQQISILKNNQWEVACHYDLSAFNKANHIAPYTAIIPSQNIIVKDNKVHFFQEVKQSPNCHFLSVDIETGALDEFWTRNGINDNWSKNASSYRLNENQEMVICPRRGRHNLIIESGDTIATWINSGEIKDDSTRLLVDPVSTINFQNSMLVFAEQGIFSIKNNTITQMLEFNNSTRRRSEFEPRAIAEIDQQHILMGGNFGGIGIVDMENFEIIWIQKNLIKAQVDLFNLPSDWSKLK